MPCGEMGGADAMERRPRPRERRQERINQMARNEVKDWAEFAIEAKDVATIRGIIEKAFKAAGGRGELPKALSVRNVLKGSVSCDARAFEAGNVADDDADVANAKAWAEAIAEGRGALDDLAEWPGLHKMVATMLRPVKAAPAPKAPPAPPAPKVKAAPVAPKAKTAPGAYSVAARLGAAHGVEVIRKGRRAA